MFNNNTLSRQRNDRLLVIGFRLLAMVGGALSILVFIFVLMDSWPALLAAGPMAFFRDRAWFPKEGLFNLAPMLGASLLAAFGAVAIAAPLGIFSGLFCTFFVPKKMSWVYRRLVELLAGIPSVVYGFWGLVVMVPWIGEYHPPGPSLIAGIFILALMVFPTMALSADAVFSEFSKEHLRAAEALGMSRSGTLCQVVFPSVRRGLFSALILQVARALGETMAILMVCGNIVQWPKGIFEPVRTLTANMALEMAYATGTHRSALFVSGLLLMVLVSGLAFVAEHFEQEIRYE